MTARDFSLALLDARDTAYKAVMKPVEGTILTVIRETAEHVAATVTDEMDFNEMMVILLDRANESLTNTPNLLPVLKEVGVVDSGGAGLLRVFEGMEAYLEGKTIEITDEVYSGDHAVQMDIEHEEFGYCTEFILQLEDERVKENKFSEDKLRHQLAKIGDSIVVVQDEDIVKVHVHTLRPGDAFNLGQQYGEFLRIKSENMSLQHDEILRHEAHEHTKTTKEPSKYAMIAVSPGSGISDMFEENGVDYIIEGGQTMNPSTEDFTRAIEQSNAKNVIILPNNSNIIMAAQQAATLAEDINVEVIPTKSIPQGLVASIMFAEGQSLEDNVEEMTEAIGEVSTGQVTYAVRDTQINGVEVTAGHYIGIANKEIICSEDGKLEATYKVIDGLNDDAEIITLICGEDVTDEEKEAVVAYCEEKTDAEVEAYNGEQPVYSFIIGVE
jgi:DAK2 domain fusion protein YloV